MSDEPLKFEYRISRGTGFLLAGGSLLVAGAAIWMALSNPFALSRWGWVSQYTRVLLYAAGSVVLARWSLRGLLADKQGNFYVVLTESEFRVPWLFGIGSVTETVIPLEHVTFMVDSRIGSAESVSVGQGKKGPTVAKRFFANCEEFETLRAALTEKLESRDVPIKRQEFRFSRPQFSLRFLLLLTLFVSIVLGFIASTKMSMAVLAAIAAPWVVMYAGVLSFLFGARWTRVFFVGVLLGICVEVAALALFGTLGVFSAPTIDGIGTIYPLTEALAGPPGDYSTTRIVWSFTGGPLLSGLVFGGLAVVVWAVVRWPGRKRRSA